VLNDLGLGQIRNTVVLCAGTEIPETAVSLAVAAVGKRYDRRDLGSSLVLDAIVEFFFPFVLGQKGSCPWSNGYRNVPPMETVSGVRCSGRAPADPQGSGKAAPASGCSSGSIIRPSGRQL